jgi:putative transposase
MRLIPTSFTKGEGGISMSRSLVLSNWCRFMLTYLRTAEGWMYLAIVMDLYSRRIVRWHIDKRMTTDLISKALVKACNLRQPSKGLVFHSDRGYQYTSKRFGRLFKGYGIGASMGDVGACWDNAVVERFFGSLKQDWIFKVAQPTREHMMQDVSKRSFRAVLPLEPCHG